MFVSMIPIFCTEASVAICLVDGYFVRKIRLNFCVIRWRRSWEGCRDMTIAGNRSLSWGEKSPLKIVMVIIENRVVYSIVVVVEYPFVE